MNVVIRSGRTPLTGLESIDCDQITADLHQASSLRLSAFFSLHFLHIPSSAFLAIQGAGNPLSPAADLIITVPNPPGSSLRPRR
ncbi:hypothetical protein A0H81_07380 [Grifola frondosa]|uniref:Uncharacterized protein n=1 Tax=Grifola frondosa TaxID=5627 RepID=A0A1C7M7Y9_GRIFR|nr:hypothetical protein A0H81_07380 [Grifola frondosa]